jgi:hypothetical protein
MKRILLVTALICSLGLTACNKANTGIVNDIKLRLFQDPQSNDTMVEMTTDLMTGNLVFSNMTIPIVDPKNPAREYGTITMQKDLNGKNLLVLTADLTAMRNGQPVDGRLLPNGSPIPVGGLDYVVAFPAGKKSLVYLGAQSNLVMLGLAVVIPQMDKIGATLPGASLFFDLPTQSKVRGLAGTFFGAQASTTGIGVFASVSNTNSAQFIASDAGSRQSTAIQKTLFQVQQKGGTLGLK